MRDDPCYNYTKRYVGCHGVCSIYSKWKSRRENIKNIIANEKRSVVDDYIRDRRRVLGR